MVEMARRYKNGYMVAQDVAKSELLIRDAAQLQHPEGQYAYGILQIEKGKEGLIYIAAAAEQGLEAAMLYMLEYEHEKGNFKTAYGYARSLSLKGNSHGTKRMADYYYEGNGVGRDKSLAKDLYREAANAGNEEAAKKLKEL
jgi:TPR repeat protein